MIKKVSLAVLAVVLIFGSLAGLYAMMIRSLIAAGSAQGVPPEAVSVGEVKVENWESTLPAVGTVVAYQGITVGAEAEGVVREISFEAGSVVEAGEVLLQIDADVENAQLRAVEAAADLARANARRANELFQTKTISRAELDGAEAALKQAEAQADNIRAVIAKKTIRAPFSGRLGIRLINLGQFVNKGDPIVSLQSLDPVYVEFSLPQQTLRKLEGDLVVRVTSDAFPEKPFEGRLTAVNPAIDATTRNLRMQATFSNKDSHLVPGMFVNAEVVLPEERAVLVIPQTAVLYAPYGDSVFVAETGEQGPDGTGGLVARQQFVRTGEKRGDFVVVTSGLEAGQKVVTTGVFKLRNGAAIVASDIAVPEAKLSPRPEDS